MLGIKKIFQKTKLPERYSDFANDRGPFPGEKITVEEILNKEIIVLQFEIRPSKLKENKGSDCLYLQLEFDKRLRMLVSGSKVLIKQCLEYKNHMPFSTAIIRKNKRYLSFS
jgi:hypothetical protein